MSARPVRWGILSTAQIGAKVWNAIRFSGNGVVAAVASRELGNAERFVRENQASKPFAEAPRAHGSYEALLADPAVEAVYVPMPTGLRRPWVEAAARAGKHVVCEKPCAESVASLRAMLAACEQAGVQFMDGTMFMHGARLGRMREVLDDGKSVGELRRVTVGFSFPGNEAFWKNNIRIDSELEPYGCVGDLGWYCLRFILWAAKWKMPTAVSGRILKQGRRAASPGTVPTRFSGEVFYDGWSASFYCSFETALHQWAHCDGVLGGLHVEDFVVPSGEHPARFWAGRKQYEAKQSADPAPDGQASCLYRHFGELVRSGRREPFWPEASLKTQTVLEACFDAALRAQPPDHL